jgi:ANTAR domain
LTSQDVSDLRNLMERYKLTAGHAFRLLARASQTTNRKLSDIAEELTQTRALPVQPATETGPASARCHPVLVEGPHCGIAAVLRVDRREAADRELSSTGTWVDRFGARALGERRRRGTCVVEQPSGRSPGPARH